MDVHSLVDFFESLEWWKRCKELPVQFSDVQAVSLGNKIYVGGATELDSKEAVARVYIYTPEEDMWDALDTPVYYFALAIYCSQLVVVGGVELVFRQQSCTNNLWTLSKESWLSLPPMKTKRQFASAVGCEHYLIVAGGEDEESMTDILDVVEVFNGHFWAYTCPLPFQPFPNMKSAVVSGHWYLTGGLKGVYFASLEVLIASNKAEPPSSVWKRIHDVPVLSPCLAEFDNHLIAVGQLCVFDEEYIMTESCLEPSIYAYSPDRCSWVHVGDILVAINCISTVIVPTGELMIVGETDSHSDTNKVFKAFSKRGVVNQLQSLLNFGDLKQKETDENSFTSEAAWDLRGVDVCGDTVAVVYSSHAQQIIWEEFGLKIYVEEGSLPAKLKQCIIYIKASLTGQYEFPENSHLVSAVFWLCCEPLCEFTKPITVEIQHCARSENVANLNLKFVRAVCNQKQLPYTFKQLRGNFTSHSSYGVIELNSFSGLAITQEGSEDREYCSQLFYFGQPNSCTIHFVVTWNLEAHLTVVKEEYNKKGAVLGLHQPVDFESENITLDIPMEGITISGWEITPLVRPVVTKKQVDNFREGKLTPCCQLLAERTSERETNIPSLKHRVSLKGAKYPNDVFLINLPSKDTSSPVRSAGLRAPTGLDTQLGFSSYFEVSSCLGLLNEDQILSVGGALGLAYNVLKKMKSLPGDMVAAWLRKEDFVSEEPTWRTLIEALKRIGQGGIAENIIIEKGFIL